MAEILMDNENGLSVGFTDSLGYSELLCLIDGTEFTKFHFNGHGITADGRGSGQDGYGNSYPESDATPVMTNQSRLKCFCLAYLQGLLRESAESDPDIRLFMSIGIWPLFIYLKSIHDDERLFYVHGRIRGLANSLGIRINMYTTIEDVLGRFTRTFSPWVPHEPIGEYCERILRVYELYQILLIDCLKRAYPEKFDYEKIISKYRNMQ